MSVTQQDWHASSLLLQGWQPISEGHRAALPWVRKESAVQMHHLGVACIASWLRHTDACTIGAGILLCHAPALPSSFCEAACVII